MAEEQNDRGRFFKALAAVQGKLKGATKNATNPHFKADFANLEAVWEVLRAPLSEHGLCAAQFVEWKWDHWVFTTRIGHESGYSEDFSIPFLVNSTLTMQQLGSALSYARRYSLAAAFGIIQTDDDGQAASQVSHSTAAAPVASQNGNGHGAPHPNYGGTAPYRIGFGKFKGKTFSEVPDKELSNWCKWLNSQPDLKPFMKETLAAAASYFALPEDQRQKDFGPPVDEEPLPF